MKISKNILQGIAIGSAATMLLTSGIAYAADYPFSKNLKAFYNNIKVVVDGNPISPRDSDGAVVEPFIVDGTTYLPLRAISGALGKEVNWDQRTYTVVIGKQSLQGKHVGLQELTPWETAFTWDTKLGGFSVAQEKIQPSINRASFGTGRSDHTASYLLKGKYKNITGNFAYPDFENSADISIKIIGDDKVLYDSPQLKKGSSPVNFDVTIVGVNHLSIQVHKQPTYTSRYYGWDYAPAELWDVTVTEIAEKK